MTMTKEFIMRKESELNLKLGYFLRCDDIASPDEIKPDMYFEMWESDAITSTLDICDKHMLNYDFGFQEFDTSEDNILGEVMLICNNHMNH
jgi:hypothetical protein